MNEAIFHGVILAFGLILPLGVQNVFVFNVGARQPTFLKTVPVIVTAGICDTLLILGAVLGVSALVFSVAWLKGILMAVGVLFLLYMGWSVWNSKPSQEEGYTGMSIQKQVLFAASVSLLNPHAILDTVGVIGTNALTYEGNEKWAFTASTITVSWIWFIGLALAGRAMGRIDRTGKWIGSLNKISAFLIWLIALFLLQSLVK